MNIEWIVFRDVIDNLLYCESKRSWDEFNEKYSTHAEGLELLATGLTQEQAQTMVKLSRGEDD